MRTRHAGNVSKHIAYNMLTMYWTMCIFNLQYKLSIIPHASIYVTITYIIQYVPYEYVNKEMDTYP